MQKSTVRVIALGAGVFLAALIPPSSGVAAERACCGPITDQGRRLEAILDGMDVESLWLAHEHINWETGRPDKSDDYDGPGKSTHCSAFAAAVGKRIGIYMLRPPEHGQILLANAQAEWFNSSKSRQEGWRTAATPQQAQSLANQGQFVVMVYPSPDPHKAGHIAIVRPSTKSASLLDANGPEITQAGQQNYTRTSARIGFRAHPGAWPEGVRYYVHSLTL